MRLIASDALSISENCGFALAYFSVNTGGLVFLQVFIYTNGFLGSYNVA